MSYLYPTAQTHTVELALPLPTAASPKLHLGLFLLQLLEDLPREKLAYPSFEQRLYSADTVLPPMISLDPRDRKAHNNDPIGPAQCQWEGCSAGFNRALDLYHHLCSEHIGRKQHQNLLLTCKWTKCNVSAAKRDHITLHMRVHVAWKPFECSTCGKGFKRPQDLKKHVKIHALDPLAPQQPYPAPDYARKRQVAAISDMYEGFKKAKTDPVYLWGMMNKVGEWQQGMPAGHGHPYAPKHQELVEADLFFQQLNHSLDAFQPPQRPLYPLWPSHGHPAHAHAQHMPEHMRGEYDQRGYSHGYQRAGKTEETEQEELAAADSTDADLSSALSLLSLAGSLAEQRRTIMKIRSLLAEALAEAEAKEEAVLETVPEADAAPALLYPKMVAA